MLSKWKIFTILAVIYAYYLMSGEKFNPDTIKGKRVLVTGASTGIGEQLAYNYAKLGARLIITARSENLLQKVSTKCRHLGAEKVNVVTADMKISEDRDMLIDEIYKMGGLDILVLNHVYGVPRYFWEGPNNYSVFHDMNTVNYVSYVEIATKLIPLLKESKGQIGVVSSVGGKVGLSGVSAYCGNKFALQGFFSALRQDLKLLKNDVSITLAVLGLIETDTAKNYMKENEKQAASDIMFKFSATPHDTAVEIIKAISTRKYELYYPLFARVIVTLHKFFPDYMEDLIAKRTNVD